MKKLILLALTFLCTLGYSSEFYVTCAPHFIGIKLVKNGDRAKARFGNQLLAYIKAQWVAEKFHLPYLHKKIDYDHLLHMGSEHPCIDEFITNHPEASIVEIKNFREIDAYLNEEFEVPIIFVIRMRTSNNQADIFSLHTWDALRKDKKFIEKMQYLLSPITPIDTFESTKDTLSIAVHIRKGGGYDLPLWSLQYYDDEMLNEEREKIYNYNFLKPKFLDLEKPFKAPPEQYYVDQLNKVFNLYPDRDFFVHIFTDDPDPANLVERIQKRVDAKGSITFSTRQKNNSHDANVVEDLIAQMQFHILIRGLSMYSALAHVFGKHALVVFPHTYKWVGRCLTYPDVIYEKKI